MTLKSFKARALSTQGFLAALRMLLATSTMFGCAGRAGHVTRIADGVEYQGRRVSAEAYALYARGAALEAKGDDVRALSAYEAARAEDSDSPEILARIGAVSCRSSRSRGDDAAEQAQESFARALALDHTSSHAWTERARCAARLGNDEEARDAALNAARFDATSFTAALLVIELASAAGDNARARAWLDELVTRAPEHRLAWQALRDFGRRTHDFARTLRAERALRKFGAGRSIAPDLDGALLEGDLERARSEARRLGLRPAELALHAVLRGASAAGRAQAELVLSADPDDGDAWIARLVAADATGDVRARLETLERAPESPTLPSPMGVRLLAELLGRLVGPEARSAWEAAQTR